MATDLSDYTLGMAKRAGANVTLQHEENTPDGLEQFKAEKGTFNVLYECSGAQAALVSAIAALRPGATILQLGLGGNMTLPMMQITAKELVLRGLVPLPQRICHRHQPDAEGADQREAADLGTVKLNNALAGFELANNRSKAMKVQMRIRVR